MRNKKTTPASLLRLLIPLSLLLLASCGKLRTPTTVMQAAIDGAKRPQQSYVLTVSCSAPAAQVFVAEGWYQVSKHTNSLYLYVGTKMLAISELQFYVPVGHMYSVDAFYLGGANCSSGVESVTLTYVGGGSK